MIVRNEETFLPDCLKSVEGVVDEMIVVDTGSTDGTVSIARAFGATVIHKEWGDDFSAARNIAIEQSTGDWVLYLDADERLDPAQGPFVRKLLANHQAGAYRIAVCGEENTGRGMQRHRTLYPRLFRRTPGVRFEGRIHEQIGPSLERNGSRIMNSGISIRHIGYAQSEHVLLRKAERNLSILRSCIQRDPTDWYLRAQLGATLNNLSRYAEAELELNAALQERSIPRGVRAMLLNTLGESCMGLGNWTRALEVFRQSIHNASNQVTARWQLASTYRSMGEVTVAIEVLDDLMSLESGPPDIVHDIVVSDSEIRFQIGLCSEQSGDSERAMSELQAAVSASPGMGEAWAGIARLHRAGGRKEDAWNALKLGFAHQSTEPLLYALAARWSIEENDMAGVENALHQAAARNISSIDLAKLSFEFALKSQNLENARRSLDTLKGLLPAGNEVMRKRIDAMSAKLVSIFPQTAPH